MICTDGRVITEHNILQHSVQLSTLFRLFWIGAVPIGLKEVLKLRHMTPRNARCPHQTSRRVRLLEKLPPDQGGLTSPKCQAQAEFAVQKFGYPYEA